MGGVAGSLGQGLQRQIFDHVKFSSHFLYDSCRCEGVGVCVWVCVCALVWDKLLHFLLERSFFPPMCVSNFQIMILLEVGQGLLVCFFIPSFYFFTFLLYEKLTALPLNSRSVSLTLQNLLIV